MKNAIANAKSFVSKHETAITIIASGALGAGIGMLAIVLGPEEPRKAFYNLMTHSHN